MLLLLVQEVYAELSSVSISNDTLTTIINHLTRMSGNLMTSLVAFLGLFQNWNTNARQMDKMLDCSAIIHVLV